MPTFNDVHDGTALARPSVGADIERVLILGDLSKLTPEQRVSYHNKLCGSLGLNPLTRPFEYLNLSGKLTLYAKKDATEQLRKLHGVSITDLSSVRLDDVFVVTAKALDQAGRTDVATGAVALSGLRGEALANALMKAETKAKRRVTLSICGLGMLDESELEAVEVEAPPPPPSTRPPVISDAQRTRLWAVAKAHGWKKPEVAALIGQRGFDSSAAITRNQYDAILGELEAGIEGKTDGDDTSGPAAAE